MLLESALCLSSPIKDFIMRLTRSVKTFCWQPANQAKTLMIKGEVISPLVLGRQESPRLWGQIPVRGEGIACSHATIHFFRGDGFD